MARFKLLETFGRYVQKKLTYILAVLAALVLVATVVMVVVIMATAPSSGGVNGASVASSPPPLIANSAVLPASAIPHRVVFPKLERFVLSCVTLLNCSLALRPLSGRCQCTFLFMPHLNNEFPSLTLLSFAVLYLVQARKPSCFRLVSRSRSLPAP